MSTIHPTAIIGPEVELGENVQVGPYAIIEGRVTIGAGSAILPHTVINGPTVIGSGCKIGPAAYIGLDPQHLGYKGEETWLIIGDHTTVRESASVHRAFKPGRENATRVGSHCFIMGLCHVAHDCKLSDHVILANGVLLGGHVEVGDRAFLGGGATMHQFVRIGRLAIVGGNEPVTQDVPPFAAVRGLGLRGYNAVGCKRAGMSRDAIRAVRAVFHALEAHRTMPASLAAIAAIESDAAEVKELVEFIRTTKRGIVPAARSRYDAASGGDAE